MSTFLSQLKTIIQKPKKRLGRGLGSGRGAKSGRGTTRHQKARENIPLHFEGGQNRLVKKFPLLRGKGRNKSNKKEVYIIYSGNLNAFNDGDVITIDSLKKKGFIEEKAKKPLVKIIQKGEVKKKLTVGLRVSRTVKQMLEKAGGTVTV